MNLPTFIVALWLLPVTVFIVVPLVICGGWLLFQASSDLLRGDIPFGAYFATRYYQDGRIQRRKEERETLGERFTAVISDGRRSVPALVANVSRNGLCLHGIPAPVPEAGSLVTVLLSQGGREIELAARPRWQTELQQGLMAGLSIDNPSHRWQEFVSACR